VQSLRAAWAEARSRAERAGGLLREWLRTNVHAIEARRVEVVDQAVRALQEDRVTVLHGIERTILHVIESGTEERRKGEQAISRRLRELDGQAQCIVDAIGAGEPLGRAPRPWPALAPDQDLWYGCSMAEEERQAMA
jgi:hypothetical protein